MSSTKLRYGMNWAGGTTELEIERQMIRRGGQWKSSKTGEIIGLGMYEHFKRFESLLWPDDKLWHRWNELQLKEWLAHRTVAVLGPASSGKTNSASTDNLADYYCFPECTTILICSTTKERLEDRIWGEIKKYHKLARELHGDVIPGHLIEGRMRLVSQSRDEVSEGRDFRNGIIGVAAKRGGDYVGLGDFIGIKNKRVRMVADELQMLPSAFVFAVSNIDKNDDVKVVGLGNPKDTTDALGAFAEPAFELGGWDGSIDQTPGTKTWKTRRPDGVAIQLDGEDSPNLDGHLGIPLITQSAIDRDIAQYGKDSLQYTMMNRGMMPKGQGSHRVLTKALAHKNGAMDEPMWADGERTRIGFMDAAYKGLGGDRCVFGELQIGYEHFIENDEDGTLVWNVVNQNISPTKLRQVVWLSDMMMVPVSVRVDIEAEEQITQFVREQCGKRGIPPSQFYFDSGMRTSLVSAMGRSWSPNVNPIDCGGAPTDRMVSDQIQMPCNKYYSKFITEMWFSIRLCIEAGQFRGMKDSVLTEGCQREWKKVGANRIEIESKKEMKEKTGKSPDLFDALACGFEGARRLGFVINSAKGTVKEADKAVEADWKRKLREKAKTVRTSGDLIYA